MKYRILGISLLEMLIVLVLLAIFLVLAAPSQLHFLRQSQDQVMSSQLLRAIQLTRSEAIMRGSTVKLAKRGAWQQGYVIMADDQLLFSFSNKMDGTLYWRASFDLDYLEFSPSGLAGENGAFLYCGKESKKPVWAISVRVGRPRLMYPDKNGDIIGSKGMPMVC